MLTLRIHPMILPRLNYMRLLLYRLLTQCRNLLMSLWETLRICLHGHALHPPQARLPGVCPCRWILHRCSFPSEPRRFLSGLLNDIRCVRAQQQLLSPWQVSRQRNRTRRTRRIPFRIQQCKTPTRLRHHLVEIIIHFRTCNSLP